MLSLLQYFLGNQLYMKYNIPHFETFNLTLPRVELMFPLRLIQQESKKRYAYGRWAH